ncbi:hypothetical protein LIP_1455 [Limnochorda pilosa]|uniref:Uncharacterized protein n=1 Tax=Limnochorda pilosa TaxID=1555112 RepID=A0A0K2SKE1_LIMPI|nr:hypothetical protein LIP_1455 [Limnochorda pilosa]
MGIPHGVSLSALLFSVHPHARGDHAAALAIGGAGVGSPPRAWGSLDLADDPVGPSRFTPTRVGITCSLCARLSPPTVHPHARGDHGVMAWKRARATGSPPRAWGSHESLLLLRLLCRFTPTRVGITAAPWR